MRRIAIVYAGLVLFAVAPILIALTSTVAAYAAGCTLDEASVHPCIVLGLDWGSALYFFLVSGWLAIATLPTGAILVAGWTMFLAIRKFRKRLAPS
jgi:hypothetical protein